MIVKLKPNRVYRTYPGGSRIDALVSGHKTADSSFPEDWLASTVRAFNPGREDIIEGLGMTEDGIPVTELAPEGLPILVKLLDAADRLVIQVHPTRAFAWEAWQSKVGKTESWYILEADETACVYIGFQEHVTREAWIDVCERQYVEGMLSMLHRFNVKKETASSCPAVCRMPLRRVPALGNAGAVRFDGGTGTFHSGRRKTGRAQAAWRHWF